jgi:hypothetical protein
MLSIRRTVVVVALSVAAFVFPASAVAGHDDETATCTTGTTITTFTIRATSNSAGFESPNPFNVLVFEEGAVLTAHTVRVNGNLVFSHAVTGRAQNTLTETTCTFTVGSGMGAGSVFEVTGILNTR